MHLHLLEIQDLPATSMRQQGKRQKKTKTLIKCDLKKQNNFKAGMGKDKGERKREVGVTTENCRNDNTGLF